MSLFDFIIIIINITVTSAGAMLLKYAAMKKLPSEKFLFSAFAMFIYALMSMLTLYLYSKFEIIFVQTILAFTFVLTPIYAHFLIKEKLNIKVIFGLLLIVIGVFFISLGYSV